MVRKQHILIVDDNREIRDLLAKYLEKSGLRTATAPDATQARGMIETHAFDLVVLDIMMPGEDGLSLCRDLRTKGTLPVILLTAMGEDADRIVGLELGADDYVTKPFNPRELLARIRAVLRRAQSASEAREPKPGTRLRFDRWTLFVDRRELCNESGTVVPLSTGEYQLLLVFVRKPGIVLTRDQLLDMARGRSAKIFDRSIDNQVSRLRRKIEDDPREPKLIQTVWGGGYKFSGKVETL